MENINHLKGVSSTHNPFPALFCEACVPKNPGGERVQNQAKMCRLKPEIRLLKFAPCYEGILDTPKVGLFSYRFITGDGLLKGLGLFFFQSNYRSWWYLSHTKIHYTGWLIRFLLNGCWKKSPHNWVGLHPLYTLNSKVFFFFAHLATHPYLFPSPLEILCPGFRLSPHLCHKMKAWEHVRSLSFRLSGLGFLPTKNTCGFRVGQRINVCHTCPHLGIILLVHVGIMHHTWIPWGSVFLKTGAVARFCTITPARKSWIRDEQWMRWKPIIHQFLASHESSCSDLRATMCLLEGLENCLAASRVAASRRKCCKEWHRVWCDGRNWMAARRSPLHPGVMQNLQNGENVAGVAVVDESTSTENFMDLSYVWCLWKPQTSTRNKGNG